MYPPSDSSPVKKLQCKKIEKNYVIKVWNLQYKKQYSIGLSIV